MGALVRREKLGDGWEESRRPPLGPLKSETFCRYGTNTDVASRDLGLEPSSTASCVTLGKPLRASVSFTVE